MSPDLTYVPKTASIARARCEGERRRRVARRAGYVDRCGGTEEERLRSDVTSSAGEELVAMRRGLAWTAFEAAYDPRAADVGRDIQVRTVPYGSNLPIRADDDHPGHRYVLVEAHSWERMRIVGWWPSEAEAHRPEWLHDGKPDFYLVPRSKLRPIEEMP